MIQIGVCTSVEHADALVASGVDFIEENIQRMLVPTEPTSTFAPLLAALRHSPLPVPSANSFLPASLKCVGPEVDRAALARYVEVACARAAEAGMTTLVLGSGGARQIPAGWSQAQARDQFVALLELMAPHAERNGVTVVVEALNRGECNLINSLAEGADVVSAVGHSNIRLLTDIYHMLREEEPADQITAYAQLITHAHIAERVERTVPGRAGDDFGAYFGALKAMHYGGAIAIEARYGQDLIADVTLGVTTLRATLPF